MKIITVILLGIVTAELLIAYFTHIEFAHRNALAEKREKEFKRESEVK